MDTPSPSHELGDATFSGSATEDDELVRAIAMSLETPSPITGPAAAESATGNATSVAPAALSREELRAKRLARLDGGGGGGGGGGSK